MYCEFLTHVLNVVMIEIIFYTLNINSPHIEYFPKLKDYIAHAI
jgi:hypothetical protein